MNDIKICLLGGDTRQTALADHLVKKGYETAVWGVPLAEKGEKTPFEGVRCADPESAVSGSRVVILPLPASTDGVRLHCPAASSEPAALRHELRLTHLIHMLHGNVLLLAGKPGDLLVSLAKEAHIKLIDYYDSETVQVKNAVPTAEGALAIAMAELPITVHDAQCTVLGYGRIGQRLSEILQALGAHVTVAARSERDLSTAAVRGCAACSLHEFLLSPGRPDILFNTIPVPLISQEVLAKLPAYTCLIELASAPGGFDLAAIRQCANHYIRAVSLPGKVAPYTAGKILFESVEKILESEGIGI